MRLLCLRLSRKSRSCADSRSGPAAKPLGLGTRLLLNESHICRWRKAGVARNIDWIHDDKPSAKHGGFLNRSCDRVSSSGWVLERQEDVVGCHVLKATRHANRDDRIASRQFGVRSDDDDSPILVIPTGWVGDVAGEDDVAVSNRRDGRASSCTIHRLPSTQQALGRRRAAGRSHLL